MADDILNSPACRENKLGLLDILHFAIGQNKEYVYNSCFYWSLIDYCTTEVRGFHVAPAKKNSLILDQRVYISNRYSTIIFPQLKMIRFQVSILRVYRFPNSSVAVHEMVELLMSGYHRSGRK